MQKMIRNASKYLALLCGELGGFEVRLAGGKRGRHRRYRLSNPVAPCS